jgi:hypothetical protein
MGRYENCLLGCSVVSSTFSRACSTSPTARTRTQSVTSSPRYYDLGMSVMFFQLPRGKYDLVCPNDPIRKEARW